MLDVLIGVFDFFLGVFKQSEAKKKKYSEYVKTIVVILDEVLDGINRGIEPHGPCAAMRTHLEHFDETFGDDPEIFMSSVKQNLWDAVDIEGIYYEARDPNCAFKLEELIGKTRALAELINI